MVLGDKGSGRSLLVLPPPLLIQNLNPNVWLLTTHQIPPFLVFHSVQGTPPKKTPSAIKFEIMTPSCNACVRDG